MKFKEFVEPKRGGDDDDFSGPIMYTYQVIKQLEHLAQKIYETIDRDDKALTVVLDLQDHIPEVLSQIEFVAQLNSVELPRRMRQTDDDPNLSTLSRRTIELGILDQVLKTPSSKSSDMDELRGLVKETEDYASKLYEYCRKNRLLR